MTWRLVLCNCWESFKITSTWSCELAHVIRASPEESPSSRRNCKTNTFTLVMSLFRWSSEPWALIPTPKALHRLLSSGRMSPLALRTSTRLHYLASWSSGACSLTPSTTYVTPNPFTQSPSQRWKSWRDWSAHMPGSGWILMPQQYRALWKRSLGAGHFPYSRGIQLHQGETGDDVVGLNWSICSPGCPHSGHREEVDTSRATRQAKALLKHRDIVGRVRQGRSGFDTEDITPSWKVTAPQKRKLVVQEIRQHEEAGRCAKGNGWTLRD